LLNMYLGRYSAAIGHLKESILLWPVDYKMSEFRDRYYLATAYKTKGIINAFKAELTAIRLLLAESNLSPTWLSSAGVLHARIGMINEASQLLADISARINDLTADSPMTRSNRGDRAAYNRLKGEIELARGNYDEALNLFQVANKLSEETWSEPLAYCHLTRGDLDGAISAYQQIISIKVLGNENQEKWILAHYYLGKAYEQKGEHEKAIESYENFLNIWKDADPDLVALVDAKKRLAKLKSDRRSGDADQALRNSVMSSSGSRPNAGRLRRALPVTSSMAPISSADRLLRRNLLYSPGTSRTCALPISPDLEIAHGGVAEQAAQQGDLTDMVGLMLEHERNPAEYRTVLDRK